MVRNQILDINDKFDLFVYQFSKFANEAKASMGVGVRDNASMSGSRENLPDLSRADSKTSAFSSNIPAMNRQNTLSSIAEVEESEMQDFMESFNLTAKQMG